MFSFLKKKEEGMGVASPIKGKTVELSQVSDPTFGECMLGKGVAILPEEGKVYAPADGEISMMFETHHAVSMVTTDGIELLIHIGLETVALKGEGFEAHVQSGDQVKKGDLLLSMDLEKIKSEGYDIISPVVVCNTDDYTDVLGVLLEKVEPGDQIIKIVK
ncbi:MAG: PTS glucose transporter subunit IIA [Lachnospiraceae bacterium]|nr:PTS glucose transporter subunit IIA [Lachnospiraceae bacterium]